MSVYSEANDLYFAFAIKETGYKPSFTKVEGKKLKELIKFFESQTKEEDKSEFVLRCFKAIFNNWHLLDDYLRKQVKLQQILSNITNILYQIKNANRKESEPASDFERKIHQILLGKPLPGDYDFKI